MKKYCLSALMMIAFLCQSAFGIDESPGFEMQDLSGSTVNYSSTVGTSPINIPTVANKVISEVFFKCSSQTPASIRCYVSFDGSTYLTLLPGEAIGWSIKGNKKQIVARGSTSGVVWEAIINYESY